MKFIKQFFLAIPLIISAFLVAGFIQKVSAQGFTACEVQIAPTPHSIWDGSKSLIYTANGSINTGTEILTVQEATAQGYGVVTAQDQINFSIIPVVGGNYSSSTDPLYNSVAFGTLSLQVCDNNNQCVTLNDGQFQLGSSISFSVSAADYSSKRISLSLTGQNSSGASVDVCRPADLQNVVSLNDLTNDLDDPDQWQPPACSNFTIDQGSTQNAATATIPLGTFDQRDPTEYVLKFVGNDINGNTVIESNDACCITNQCTGSGWFINIINICEQSDLTLSVTDLQTKAYNGGWFALYDAGYGSQPTAEPVCRANLRVDPEENEVIIDDVTNEQGQNPGQQFDSEYKLCRQIANTTLRFYCQQCRDNEGIWTAIGCISQNPANAIKTFVGIALNVAGGVAILLILTAAFRFATSQGDPKRVGDAKELLQSAVIGLLFVIFSVTILQFIGSDILRIPGFGN